MDSVGFGVIGGRSFVATAAVLPAIAAADGAHLAAIAARSGPVDPSWHHAAVESYEAVIEHPDVDVVYVPLPNGRHRVWVEAAAAAGKHVLCEKPLAPNGDDAAAMAGVCRRAGVLLIEAWMTPFAPRWRHALDRARSGDLGAVVDVETAFTFTIGEGNEANYRWDPHEGGGALLDVGIYALGPAVALWGAEPAEVNARAIHTDRGVDLTTWGELVWPNEQRATFRVSFGEDERQHLQLTGSEALIRLESEAHTGDPSAEELVEVRKGETRIHRVVGADPYRGMIEGVARAVTGQATWPRPAEEAVALLRLLDRIAAASLDEAESM